MVIRCPGGCSFPPTKTHQSIHPPWSWNQIMQERQRCVPDPRAHPCRIDESPVSRPSPSAPPQHPPRGARTTCVQAGQYDRCAPCATVLGGGLPAPATVPRRTGSAADRWGDATAGPAGQRGGRVRWTERGGEEGDRGKGRGGLRVVGSQGQAGAQSLGGWGGVGWGARGNKNRRDFVEGDHGSYGHSSAPAAQVSLRVCACAFALAA